MKKFEYESFLLDLILVFFHFVELLLIFGGVLHQVRRGQLLDLQVVVL
jgi:hypothetical protein